MWAEQVDTGTYWIKNKANLVLLSSLHIMWISLVSLIFKSSSKMYEKNYTYPPIKYKKVGLVLFRYADEIRNWLSYKYRYLNRINDCSLKKPKTLGFSMNRMKWQYLKWVLFLVIVSPHPIVNRQQIPNPLAQGPLACPFNSEHSRIGMNLVKHKRYFLFCKHFIFQQKEM